MAWVGAVLNIVNSVAGVAGGGADGQASAAQRCLLHAPGGAELLEKGVGLTTGAMTEALKRPGVTVAVVDLGFLLPANGVLDRLKAGGATITGGAAGSGAEAERASAEQIEPAAASSASSIAFQSRKVPRGLRRYAISAFPKRPRASCRAPSAAQRSFAIDSFRTPNVSCTPSRHAAGSSGSSASASRPERSVRSCAARLPLSTLET